MPITAAVYGKKQKSNAEYEAHGYETQIWRLIDVHTLDKLAEEYGPSLRRLAARRKHG